jgi:hypothetical protein
VVVSAMRNKEGAREGRVGKGAKEGEAYIVDTLMGVPVGGGAEAAWDGGEQPVRACGRRGWAARLAGAPTGGPACITGGICVAGPWDIA